MRRSKPFFTDNFKDEDSTRKKSDRQEKSLAKSFKGGRVYSNSGATFGENDVSTDRYSIEAKTTDKKSFIVKRDDLNKARRKTEAGKTTLFIVEFKDHGKPKDSYVIISLNDFKDMDNLINSD